jgi:hypothetical protein
MKNSVASAQKLAQRKRNHALWSSGSAQLIQTFPQKQQRSIDLSTNRSPVRVFAFRPPAVSCFDRGGFMKATKKNLERVKLLARDLRDGKQFPRSPRDTYAGYVLAARAVDKCRAVLAGTEGEYHSNCPLDQIWLKFAGIDYDAFRSFVATGATDDQIAKWIGKTAQNRPRTEIIAWNNQQRDMRLSDLPPRIQEYMEDYIPKFLPRHRVVYHWFDVYDLEEQRL